MKSAVRAAALLLGAAAAATAGGTAYFYRRTMKRSRAKVERTMKMAGTDWNQYQPLLKARKEYMLAQPHEDVFITSDDGLKLHGVYFPAAEGSGETVKAVICCHGYTSQCMSDFIGLSDYYLKRGYHMLLPDARAHGQSEGTYIGFGCLDRYDIRKWIDWLIEQCGSNVQILLHGISMGGATVLMTGSLDLPEQVKGIISDCGFTYECNAAREAAKVRVPVLLIHGDRDTFVPSSMCEKIYQSCASPKKKLIVKGAAHAESYYKDTAAYEAALDDFIGGVIAG